MKKRPGIPPYNDPADGPLTPEQIEENKRMSVDGVAAINVALEMGMSFADAYEFVQKNRDKFVRLAAVLVEDQSVADAARSIKALDSLNASKAGRANQGKTKSVSRFEKEYPLWEQQAKIALASNPALDLQGIAKAIKLGSATNRAIGELRKWVKKNEVTLRHQGEILARQAVAKMNDNAKKARKATLSR